MIEIKNCKPGDRVTYNLNGIDVHLMVLKHGDSDVIAMVTDPVGSDSFQMAEAVLKMDLRRKPDILSLIFPGAYCASKDNKEGKEMMYEGRGWMKHVEECGGKIVSDMVKGKVYLHQMYTTVFIEFGTKEEVDHFKEIMDKTSPYWDYDPVSVIDTTDQEQCEKWAMHIKDQNIELRAR